MCVHDGRGEGACWGCLNRYRLSQGFRSVKAFGCRSEVCGLRALGGIQVWGEKFPIWTTHVVSKDRGGSHCPLWWRAMVQG